MFDLDNTLYPHHLNLWQQVDERIRSYVAEFLKVSKDEAFRVQKDYYKRYGTTMRGLMTEHGMKPDDYPRIRAPDRPLAARRPIRRSATRSKSCPGRKLILTNGTRKHAEAVMAAARNRPPLRGRVRHRRRRSRPQAAAAGLRALPRAARRRSAEGRDVRGSGAQPGSAARARHDHRAGGAARPRAKCSARAGSWRGATRPMSITSPTTSPVTCATSSRRRRRNELLHQHGQARCRRCRRRPGAVSPRPCAR